MAGRKTGAEVMIDILLRNGVEICWGYPGGAILPFYDTLFHYADRIRHILVRHEQAAAHAAEGYAKATGKLGVAIATSGPGATNLVTGITDAKMDSVPILAITGQVPTSAIGSDAFQECDIYGISLPITKYNALLKNVDDVARITQEAITVAMSGRPGPALIDFPKDIQTATTEVLQPGPLKIHPRHWQKPAITGDLDRLIEALDRARSPMLYVGGGAITANAAEKVRLLAEKGSIPVATTLMGIGAFPGNHRLSLGMLGMHGTAYANKAVMECDLILALGARFDDRVALHAPSFAQQAVRAMVDIDLAEINKRVKVDIWVSGDLADVLSILVERIKAQNRTSWVERIQALKAKHPLRYFRGRGDIKPQLVIEKLWEKTRGQAIISTDVGQHQMWAAQYYPINEARQWLTSGGLGTMGFGFPAGLGAKLGRPEKEVVVITGDGSFQMNMQELATARMYDIPVKIILFNNGFLGMVRQWQELFYNQRFSHSDMDYNPDFVKICEGYDIPAMRIEHEREIDKGLDFLLKSEDAALLEVMIPQAEKVYPMIASGQRYETMTEVGEPLPGEEEYSTIPNREVEFIKI
ncbi:MAG: biosynthetic-type acetolactate synthase large subunit [Leptospiraceae bacterium]|nr:biosynthetic-type acetolactate synthase large subunit [Leptospiraceae bacterium]MDW8306291.1 biosynthetic-type acetolactate synthase large subunit [Leptospiraceae bacterium]